jgi:ABC-type molybdate transport system substrate-binding protein
MKPARVFLTCLLPLRALPAAPAGAVEDIPGDKDEDLRVFYPDGRVVRGEEALALMSGGRTDLNISLAGNQFFAMADVIQAFRQGRPGTVTGLITLPPGKALGAALKGGWRYRDREYRFIPDVIGQVDMASLRKLRAAAMASEYITYMHNELVLMVAAGNPRGIRGIGDLGRDDLRRVLPNPVTEGIMTFYAKPVLEAHGLWHKLSHGRECQACAPVRNVYFTTVHHREIPAAIQAGTADVGIVWATEGRHALEQGAQIDIVRLPAGDSKINDIVYVASPLDHAPHKAAAAEYVAFLGSAAAQAAYARHGFVRAGGSERVVREIP